MTTTDNNEKNESRTKQPTGGARMRKALIAAAVLLVAGLYGRVALLRYDPVPAALDATAGQLALLAGEDVQQPNLSASGGLNALIAALPDSLAERVRSNPDYGFILSRARTTSAIPAGSPSSPASRGLIIAIVKDDSPILKTHGRAALPTALLINLDSLAVSVINGDLKPGALLRLQTGGATSGLN